MVKSILKKDVPRKLVFCTDAPQLSMAEYNDRRRVLGGITRLALSDQQEQKQTDGNVCPITSQEQQQQQQQQPNGGGGGGTSPHVEITGLELLMFGDDMNTSDFSFDSYAQDSFDVAQGRAMQRTMNLSSSSNNVGDKNNNNNRVRAPRRMSNCSSIGEDESYGYEAQYVPPRSDDSLPVVVHDESSSLSNDDDLVVMVPDYGRYTRRSSIDSYAEDSVGYEFERYYNSKFENSHLSIGSSTSYANDSVYNNKKDPATTTTTTATPSRRSSMGSYANDSFNLQHLSKMKRRSSNGSLYAFSKDVYDTQSINTGGVGRAA